MRSYRPAARCSCAPPLWLECSCVALRMVLPHSALQQCDAVSQIDAFWAYRPAVELRMTAPDSGVKIVDSIEALLVSRVARIQYAQQRFIDRRRTKIALVHPGYAASRKTGPASDAIPLAGRIAGIV